jgi:hypothetical protein
LRHGDDERVSVSDHSDEWRRALRTLADLPDGSTEALLLAHGFTTSVIAGLVDTGLATSTTEPILAGGQGVLSGLTSSTGASAAPRGRHGLVHCALLATTCIASREVAFTTTLAQINIEDLVGAAEMMRRSAA